jgi:hypothetical protein
MEACSCVAVSWVLNPLIFVPNRSDNLVPNLQTFVVKKIPYPMVSAYNEVFADMVESRWCQMDNNFLVKYRVSAGRS